MNPVALWYRTTPPVLRRLMAVLAGLYAAWLVAALLAFVAPALAPLRGAFDLLTLDPAPTAAARWPWALVTHAFVNVAGGPWGLIGMVFALFFLNTLGRDAEDMLGGRWLLGAWLAAALGAGLAAVGVTALTGRGLVVFGPWPGVLGVMMALGVRFPFKTIGLMLVGAVKLTWAALGLFGLGLLFSPLGAVPEGGAIAAGALMGWASARGLRVPVAVPRAFGGARAERPGARRAERPRSTTDEVDRILEKISAHGVGSLTDDERRTLEEASRR